MHKVVVHSFSRGSFRGGSGKYVHYEVVSGPNPFGPRGGLGGDFVDGEKRKHFWKREEAEEFAKYLALKEGLEYLTTYSPDNELVSPPKKLKSNFDIEAVIDDRKKRLRSAYIRNGQKKFRNQVMNAFGGKCVISHCDIPQTLQACHIYSYLGEATNHPSNGLLLRSDFHGLFDNFLISVSPKGRLLLSSTLKNSTYIKYKNIKLRLPDEERHQISDSALEFHRNTYKQLEAVRKANKLNQSDVEKCASV